MKEPKRRGKKQAFAKQWPEPRSRAAVATPGGAPSNKRLQLTPNSSFQSIRGTVLAAGTVPRRRRSALLGAAEPHVRYASCVWGP